ncbi:MAG: hypothetical protein RLZZ179_594 [Verrucomicrobiota bacterium]
MIPLQGASGLFPKAERFSLTSPAAVPEASLITVTVEGYGGGEDEEEESAEEKDRKARSEAAPPAEE